MVDLTSALAIAGQTHPAERDVDRVLAWAENAPGPEKLWTLLLLARPRGPLAKHAARVDAALLACAKPEPKFLFEVLGSDCDPERFRRAVRVLCAIGTKAIVVRLARVAGSMPFPRASAREILAAAAAKNVALESWVRAPLAAKQGLTDQEVDATIQLRRGLRWNATLALTEATTPLRRANRAKPGATGGPAPLPAAFLLEGETVALVARLKRSLENRAKLSSMAALFEIDDLACFVLALGRDAAAASICGYLLDNVAPTTNKHVWTPVGYAACLQAHVFRQKGSTKRAQAALATVVAHPFHADLDGPSARRLIDAATSQIDLGAAEKSPKSACRRIARALLGLFFVAEFPHDAKVDRRAAGAEIVRGLEILRHRLTATSTTRSK